MSDVSLTQYARIYKEMKKGLHKNKNNKITLFLFVFLFFIVGIHTLADPENFLIIFF